MKVLKEIVYLLFVSLAIIFELVASQMDEVIVIIKNFHVLVDFGAVWKSKNPMFKLPNRVEVFNKLERVQIWIDDLLDLIYFGLGIRLG